MRFNYSQRPKGLVARTRTKRINRIIGSQRFNIQKRIKTARIKRINLNKPLRTNRFNKNKTFKKIRKLLK